MRAQITLTSTESKKLVARAVAAMDPVRKAMSDGLIVIHPSSTTLFLVEELTGKRPEGLWACGVVFPRGMCVSWERQQAVYLKPPAEKSDAGQFPFSWVLEKGVFRTGLTLYSLFERMGKEDVYVKGVNAIDSEGNAGVLYAGPGGGTISKALAASRQKGFSMILPSGLEKLIPTPISKAAKAASREKMDMAMGIPVGLLPVSGTVVTEIEAIHLLSGAEATVIAAGGMGGAEGSISLVIQGPDEKVSQAFQMMKEVKGATLPEIRPTDCSICFFPTCHFRERSC
jgi:hypothetical protein